MTFAGMDIQAVLRVADQLHDQATRLDEATRAVDHLTQTASTHWQGPDIGEFRTRWDTQYRRTSAVTAQQLRDLADLARRNAQAQQATSDTLDGGAAWTGGGLPAGPGGGLPAGPGGGPPAEQSLLDKLIGWGTDRVNDGIEWASSTAQGVGEWVEARAADVSNVVKPRLDALDPAWRRLENAMGIAGSQFTRMFTEGRVPQVAELGASAILVGATAVGVGLNLGSGRDVGFFEPGKPWAGQPVPQVVYSQGPDGPNTAVKDFDSFTTRVLGAYNQDGVTVDAITKDGVTRYIVTIPGTEAELASLGGWSNNANAHNWAANVYALAQGGTATNAQAVAMAIRNAGVPEGAEIVLAGHSQGGIIAANLAADPSFTGSYNVRGVVAMASPIECADFPPNSTIPVLSVNHDNDLIPKLDFNGVGIDPRGAGGTGDNISTVTLPKRGQGLPLMDWFRATHGQDGYASDIAALTGSGRQTVVDYEQSVLNDFYATDGATDQRVVVQFGG